jgi:hypothetical protein
MPCVEYTFEQVSVSMYDTYMQRGSTRKVRRFWHKFQDVAVPHKDIIHRIVNTLRQGCYCTKHQI